MFYLYLIIGLFLRLPIFDQVPRERLFDDELSWEVPEEEHEERPHVHMYRTRDPDDEPRNRRPDGTEPSAIPLMRR